MKALARVHHITTERTGCSLKACVSRTKRKRSNIKPLDTPLKRTQTQMRRTPHAHRRTQRARLLAFPSRQDSKQKLPETNDSLVSGKRTAQQPSQTKLNPRVSLLIPRRCTSGPRVPTRQAPTPLTSSYSAQQRRTERAPLPPNASLHSCCYEGSGARYGAHTAS